MYSLLWEADHATGSNVDEKVKEDFSVLPNPQPRHHPPNRFTSMPGCRLKGGWESWHSVDEDR
jgi:hypothetical protein